MSDIDSKIGLYESLIEDANEDNNNLNKQLDECLFKLKIIDNYKTLKNKLSKKVFIILTFLTLVLSCLPNINILLLISINITIGLIIPKVKFKKEREIFEQNKRENIIEKIDYLKEEIDSNDRNIKILSNGINNLKSKNYSSESRILLKEEPMTKQMRLALGRIS